MVATRRTLIAALVCTGVVSVSYQRYTVQRRSIGVSGLGSSVTRRNNYDVEVDPPVMNEDHGIKPRCNADKNQSIDVQWFGTSVVTPAKSTV